MPRFAVLVLVGPGSEELIRLKDLVESIFLYEPSTNDLVIVHGGQQTRAITDCLRLPETCRLVILPESRELPASENWHTLFIEHTCFRSYS